MSSKIFNDKGYTLVELLIAAIIIGVIAVVATPNLNKFSQEQKMDNVASQIIQAIRKTQSNALSYTQCSSGYPAKYWSVLLANNNFQIKGTCHNLSNPAAVLPTDTSTVPYTAGTISLDSRCGLNNSIEIFYQGRNVYSKCSTDTEPGLPINSEQIITLSSSGLTSIILKINPAGLVYR